MPVKELALAVMARPGTDPGPFLQALEREGTLGAETIEVHIAHPGAWPPGPEAANLYLHPCPGEASVLWLWAEAVRQARRRARYVAVLDTAAPLAPGWLAAAEAVIASAVPIAFGPVLPSFEPEQRDIIPYLAEYAQFMPPLSPRLKEVPGNNLLLRSELIPSETTLRTHGLEKTFLIDRLRSRERVRIDRREAMVVVCSKPFAADRYAASRYRHGRCYGARRLAGAIAPVRWAVAAVAPLLPLLRLFRIGRACAPHPLLRQGLRRHLAAVLLAETAWSLGELAGYLRGDGGACRHLD